MKWLDKLQDGAKFDGLTNKGFNYNSAWGGAFENGGSTGYSQSKESIESARSKPGGSNVGKYNPNQTFAGPSGGSPRGSYPIGDIGHAKSALKLAHNAPNPSGIKAAVYKKYPELKKQMGGSIGGNLPGVMGNMYSRNGTPSNSKYAKKTLPSAQSGKSMDYFKAGLDFEPKTISQSGSVITDEMGQWKYPGEITRIPSNDITMEGVPFDVYGISNTGDKKLMKPGKKYKFKGSSVTEYPQLKNGTELDQLTNFTNYNTKQPGGWLDNL